MNRICGIARPSARRKVLDYTYSFTVSGSGTGYVDFRDPFSSSGTFFTAGFYRLKLGDGAPELSRISGGSKIAKTWTGRGGGDGTYTVALHGSSISISGKGSLLGERLWPADRHQVAHHARGRPGVVVEGRRALARRLTLAADRRTIYLVN